MLSGLNWRKVAYLVLKCIINQFKYEESVCHSLECVSYCTNMCTHV